MRDGFWEPGIGRRRGSEAWRGRVYFAWPVRVVADDERGVALYVAEGTRFTFPPGGWPFDDVASLGRAGGLDRPRPPRDAPSRRRVRDLALLGGRGAALRGLVREPAGAVRRGTVRSFVTQDHELDLWVTPDGSWTWKDEQELEDWVGRGRFTADEVAAIRRGGRARACRVAVPDGLGGLEPRSVLARARASRRLGLRVDARDGFLLDPDVVQLNHGSYGACPIPVFEEYQRFQRRLEEGPTDFFTRAGRARDLVGPRAPRAARGGARRARRLRRRRCRRPRSSRPTRRRG